MTPCRFGIPSPEAAAVSFLIRILNLFSGL
jgi:hypothetical protein